MGDWEENCYERVPNQRDTEKKPKKNCQERGQFDEGRLQCQKEQIEKVHHQTQKFERYERETL